VFFLRLWENGQQLDIEGCNTDNSERENAMEGDKI